MAGIPPSSRAKTACRYSRWALGISFTAPPYPFLSGLPCTMSADRHLALVCQGTLHYVVVVIACPACPPSRHPSRRPRSPPAGHRLQRHRRDDPHRLLGPAAGDRRAPVRPVRRRDRHPPRSPLRRQHRPGRHPPRGGRQHPRRRLLRRRSGLAGRRRRGRPVPTPARRDPRPWCPIGSPTGTGPGWAPPGGHARWCTTPA